MFDGGSEMEAVAELKPVIGSNPGRSFVHRRGQGQPHEIRGGEERLVIGQEERITQAERLDPALQASQVADGGLVTRRRQGGKPGPSTGLERRRFSMA
jgi:hypothetical protein